MSVYVFMVNSWYFRGAQVYVLHEYTKHVPLKLKAGTQVSHKDQLIACLLMEGKEARECRAAAEEQECIKVASKTFKAEPEGKNLFEQSYGINALHIYNTST